MAEAIPPGTLYASAYGVSGARRRRNARLAVSRPPFLEPMGGKREEFYEQRLLLGLPWSDLPAFVRDVGINFILIIKIRRARE